jgi:hypothetical protein
MDCPWLYAVDNAKTDKCYSIFKVKWGYDYPSDLAYLLNLYV